MRKTMRCSSQSHTCKNEKSIYNPRKELKKYNEYVSSKLQKYAEQYVVIQIS